MSAHNDSVNEAINQQFDTCPAHQICASFGRTSVGASKIAVKAIEAGTVSTHCEIEGVSCPWGSAQVRKAIERLR